MASVVEICNMALARLGDEATVASIKPPEGSAQAGHCAAFYPLARNTLLESHAWSFATERVHLAQLWNNPGWTEYRYSIPSTSLRVLGVFPSSDDLRYWPYEKAFEVERSGDGSVVISTNVESAWARVIMAVPDPMKFPPQFVDALAWLLASYLAGPVLKGNTGAQAAQSMYKIHAAVAERARFADSNQRQQRRTYMPAGIASRG